MIIEFTPGSPPSPREGDAPVQRTLQRAPAAQPPEAMPPGAAREAPAVQGPQEAAPAQEAPAQEAMKPIDGRVAMAIALFTGIAASMDGRPDWPSMRPGDAMGLLRQWAVSALMDAGPRLSVSPLKAMPGSSGLAYAVPALHATLGADAARAFDAQCGRLRTDRRGRTALTRGRLRRMESLDLASGATLPWGSGDAVAALLAADAAAFQARGDGTDMGPLREGLLRRFDADGAGRDAVCAQTAIVANAGMASDENVLWGLYEPVPSPLGADAVASGVRPVMGEAGYRSAMERTERAMLARQKDPEARGLIPRARRLAADVLADPSCLDGTVYGVEDLLDADGACPPILVDQARLVFGVARSMAMDGLDADAVYRVVSGSVPGAADGAGA